MQKEMRAKRREDWIKNSEEIDFEAEKKANEEKKDEGKPELDKIDDIMKDCQSEIKKDSTDPPAASANPTPTPNTNVNSAANSTVPADNMSQSSQQTNQTAITMPTLNSVVAQQNTAMPNKMPGQDPNQAQNQQPMQPNNPNNANRLPSLSTLPINNPSKSKFPCNF
jgi:hypothetical protein